MQKFCSNCGSELDKTGVCTVCNNAPSENATANNDAPSDINIQDVHQSKFTYNKTPHEKAKLKRKIKKAKDKARKNVKHTLKWKKMSKKQRTTAVAVRAVAALLCVLVVVGASLGALTYFGVADIGFMNQALNKIGLTTADTSGADTMENFTNIIVKDEESAIKAAQDAAKKLGLKNAANHLNVSLYETVNDITYCRMQQTHKGIPVYNNGIVITADKNGHVLGCSSNLSDIKTVNTEHTLTRATAYEKIQEYLANKGTSADIAIMMFSHDELCYIISSDKKAYLYYDLLVCFNSNMHHVLINANTAEVISCTPLYRYNESEVANATTLDGKEVNINISKSSVFAYELSDTVRAIDVYNANAKTASAVYEFYIADRLVYKFYTNTRTWFDADSNQVNIDQPTGIVYDENGNEITEYFEDAYDESTVKVTFCTNDDSVSLAKPQSVTKLWPDNTSATVMYNCTNTYDYFKKMFGRDGYDNKHSLLNVVYNDELNGRISDAMSTSAYGSACINIGLDSTYAADVIAHEYTHCVVDSISDIEYSDEGSSIIEAYCDIFSELIEAYGNNNSCDWIFAQRNIADPQSSNMPDTYSKNLWTGETAQTHDNSTVISHAAYLMSTDSGSKNALNHEQLAKLWYHTLYTLPSNADCLVLKEQMLLTSNILGFDTKQIGCITSAFELCGITDKNSENPAGFGAVKVTINGPVDVTVISPDGETISSTDGLSGVSNSFCAITYNGPKSSIKKDIDPREKTIRFSAAGDYDIRLTGTAKGSLTYTISFADESGRFTDKRTLRKIDIEKGTIISTSADDSSSTEFYVDHDGDNSSDYTMKASKNSDAKETSNTLLYITLAIIIILIAFTLVYLVIKRQKSNTAKRYPKTF